MISQGIRSRLTRAQRRVLDLVERQPNQFTYRICRDAAVGNVSDAAAKINQKFQILGVPYRLTCTLQKAPNRFGQTVRMGRWKLSRLPGNKELENANR